MESEPAKKKTKKKKKKTKKKKRAPFRIAGEEVAAGERRLVELGVTRHYTTTSDVVIPVYVLHGKQDGPRLFVCAAIHGDEINGVDAIRRLLQHRPLQRLRGTLLAVPVVNVHGFLAQNRYLPDRRDLNRSFPGLARGSLAARVAKTFMEEVVARCTHGIDLHTGSHHRSNLPQVRADLDDPETRRLADAFDVPVMIHAKLRDGSLRHAATERGIPTLLFEGGEALRFQRRASQAALRGILGVMHALEMLPGKRTRRTRSSFAAQSTKWVRAPESGIMVTDVRLGATVHKEQQLGLVTDPYGLEETPIKASVDGVVIGRTNLPLVNEGDALFHIAHCDDLAEAAESLSAFREDLDPPGADDRPPVPPDFEDPGLADG